MMMTDEQIKHMTERFLQWKLPQPFRPDAGISFEPEFNVEWNAKHGRPPQRHEPLGTNLFGYEEAEAMVRHMLEGMTGEAPEIDPLAYSDPRRCIRCGGFRLQHTRVDGRRVCFNRRGVGGEFATLEPPARERAQQFRRE
jgi:hypothetical protein